MALQNNNKVRRWARGLQGGDGAVGVGRRPERVGAATAQSVLYTFMRQSENKFNKS